MTAVVTAFVALVVAAVVGPTSGRLVHSLATPPAFVEQGDASALTGTADTPVRAKRRLPAAMADPMAATAVEADRPVAVADLVRPDRQPARAPLGVPPVIDLGPAPPVVAVPAAAPSAAPSPAPATTVTTARAKKPGKPGSGGRTDPSGSSSSSSEEVTLAGQGGGQSKDEVKDPKGKDKGEDAADRGKGKANGHN